MKFSLVVILGLILCVTFSAAATTNSTDVETTLVQDCETSGDCDSGESCCETLGIDSVKYCYTESWINAANSLIDTLDCYGAYTQVAAGVFGVFVAASML